MSVIGSGTQMPLNSSTEGTEAPGQPTKAEMDKILETAAVSFAMTMLEHTQKFFKEFEEDMKES